MRLGLDYVESGPLVRSSYHSEKHVILRLWKAAMVEGKSVTFAGLKQAKPQA